MAERTPNQPGAILGPVDERDLPRVRIGRYHLTALRYEHGDHAKTPQEGDLRPYLFNV